jgi:predicted aspartyl protease
VDHPIGCDVISTDLEATLRLRVQDPSGQEQEIEAVIDNGFNGSLTLPPSLIYTLGLPWLAWERVLLGDGRMEQFAATVVWDGEPLRVVVDAADTDPLVGMALMYGYDLNIQGVEGGAVTLERLVNH